jgi:preprotein translocase subunit SecE
VAKSTPGQFISQVRTEAGKIVWPTRKQTGTTALMVLIMTSILAFFFLGVDSLFNLIVKALLSLVS